MTYHYSLPVRAGRNPFTVLIDAVRSRREARDMGRSTQPCLSRALDRHGCTILAPVVDSLIHIFESALGRPMHVGSAAHVSRDEDILFNLVNGSLQADVALDCGPETASILHCALQSIRIMMALSEVAGERPVPAWV